MANLTLYGVWFTLNRTTSGPFHHHLEHVTRSGQPACSVIPGNPTKGDVTAVQTRSF